MVVSGPVAPEFIEPRWTRRARRRSSSSTRTPCGPHRREEGEIGEIPMPISRDTDSMQRPPVVAEFDSIISRFTSTESPPRTGDAEEMAGRRQAEGGEVMVRAAAHHVHGAQAAGEVRRTCARR